MKQVTIVVPKGDVNLSSITGSYEILTRANEYWRAMGNKSMIEVRIAGFVKELKMDVGFFSVNPVNIREIKKNDLVIIPSLSYDEHVMEDNKELV
ncbi:MAG TPA: AraC family transcriptional regulator, partial [Chryseolinea sp.]